MGGTSADRTERRSESFDFPWAGQPAGITSGLFSRGAVLAEGQAQLDACSPPDVRVHHQRPPGFGDGVPDQLQTEVACGWFSGRLKASTVVANLTLVLSQTVNSGNAGTVVGRINLTLNPS